MEHGPYSIAEMDKQPATELRHPDTYIVIHL
jgi:hypothetical protein